MLGGWSGLQGLSRDRLTGRAEVVDGLGFAPLPRVLLQGVEDAVGDRQRVNRCEAMEKGADHWMVCRVGLRLMLASKSRW